MSLGAEMELFSDLVCFIILHITSRQPEAQNGLFSSSLFIPTQLTLVLKHSCFKSPNDGYHSQGM